MELALALYGYFAASNEQVRRGVIALRERLAREAR